MNKTKFKNSLKYIALAMSLAFTGPILYVMSLNTHQGYILNTIFILLGFSIMLGAIYFGFKGIKTLLSSFFDNPNE